MFFKHNFIWFYVMKVSNSCCGSHTYFTRSLTHILVHVYIFFACRAISHFGPKPDRFKVPRSHTNRHSLCTNPLTEWSRPYSCPSYTKKKRTNDEHPCSERGSNSWSKISRGRRLSLRPQGHRDLPYLWYGVGFRFNSRHLVNSSWWTILANCLWRWV